MEQALAKAAGKTGRRRLDEKDKKLWAPMADRSGLKITGDHIVITRENGFTFDKDAVGVERGEGEQLIIDLQSERRLLGQTDDGVKLFASGQKINQLPEEDEDVGNTGRKSRRNARLAEGESGNPPEDEGFESGEDDDEMEDGSDVESEFNEMKLGKMFRKQVDEEQEDDVAFADSDSDLGSISGDEDQGSDFDDDEDDEEDPELKWKDNMMERASKLHGRRKPFRAVDLARYMYDESLAPTEAIKKWAGQDEEEDIEEDIEEDDETFFRRTGKENSEDNWEDRMIPKFDYEQLEAKWSDKDAVEALRNKFATANLLDEADGEGGDGSDFEGLDDEDEDDEGDGAFEDLEAEETNGGDEDGEEEEDEEEPPAESLEAEREKNARRKEELKLRFEEEDREGFKNDKAIARREGGNDEEFGEDDWYDAQKAMIQKQLDINKAEFENLDESQRIAVEGYKAGKYARMVIEGVPAEFVKNFRPRIPIVVGGLSATEDRFGFVQVRIKKHRWHKKILKTGDPLIFSLGWRRFQSLPIYSISDSRTRNRMLKYTPEHMHCFGTFYGPLCAPNTGFTCFQSFSSANPGFRIAATGTVLSVDESTEIVKKLKLVCYSLSSMIDVSNANSCPDWYTIQDLQEHGLHQGHVQLGAGNRQVRGCLHQDRLRYPRSDQARTRQARRPLPCHLRGQDPAQRHCLFARLVPHQAAPLLQPGDQPGRLAEYASHGRGPPRPEHRHAARQELGLPQDRARDPSFQPPPRPACPRGRAALQVPDHPDQEAEEGDVHAEARGRRPRRGEEGARSYAEAHDHPQGGGGEAQGQEGGAAREVQKEAGGCRGAHPEQGEEGEEGLLGEGG